KARNVALASTGAKATASGVYSNGSDPRHQLAHINDGHYGNSFSWISNERGAGWVQIEFARPERIDRVVWSRDRGKDRITYEDRLATAYRFEVSMDGKAWRTVAVPSARLPISLRKRIASIPTLSTVPPDRVAEITKVAALRNQLDEQIKGLT